MRKNSCFQQRFCLSFHKTKPKETLCFTPSLYLQNEPYWLLPTKGVPCQVDKHIHCLRTLQSDHILFIVATVLASLLVCLFQTPVEMVNWACTVSLKAPRDWWLEWSFQNTDLSHFILQVGWLMSSGNPGAPERSLGVQWRSQRKSTGPKEEIKYELVCNQHQNHLRKTKTFFFLCFLPMHKKNSVGRFYPPETTETHKVTWYWTLRETYIRAIPRGK